MFKAKLITTIIVFSTALVVTSIIKNQTRDIEKKIESKPENKISGLILPKKKPLIAGS